MMDRRFWLLLALVVTLPSLVARGAIAGTEQDGDQDAGDEGDEADAPENDEDGDIEWGDDEGSAPPSGDDEQEPAAAGEEKPAPGEEKPAPGEEDPAAGGDEGDVPGEDDAGGEGAEGDGDEIQTDGGDDEPDLGRPDDIDTWEGEIEQQDLNQVKKREEVKVDIGEEPERIGISGNWYQVSVDCLYCETILGQNLEIDEPSVMRQFYDHLQIEPDHEAGKMVYPSEGINRPVYVEQDGDRVVVFMYTIDVGERTTPLYCTIWDLQWMLSDQKLLYGRRYSVDAYQPFAFTDWEKGYKADESFLPREQLLAFLDLSPVRAFNEEEKVFAIGDKAVLTYLGSDAFVRSDFDQEPYDELQQKLFEEKMAQEERERKRAEALDKGIAAFEDRSYEEAVEQLRQAGELGESSVDFHFYLGASLQGLKKYDQAIQHYEQVLEQSPRDNATRFNLALSYERLGEYEKALDEYRVIIDQDPDDMEAKERAFNLALQLQE